MTARAAAALLAALAIAGCAPTWSELQRRAPTHAGVFELRVEALASCTLRSLRDTTDPVGPLHGLVYEWVDAERGLVALVRGGYPGRDGDGLDYPALEVRVAQETGVATLAQVRVGRSAGAALARAAWSAVACCARDPGGRRCGGH
ncbi:MAG TPA: hypothetical protein VGQ83_28005 [Polyangia bacterium]